MTFFKRLVHPLTRKYYIEWPYLVAVGVFALIALTSVFVGR